MPITCFIRVFFSSCDARGVLVRTWKRPDNVFEYYRYLNAFYVHTLERAVCKILPLSRRNTVITSLLTPQFFHTMSQGGEG